MSTREKLIKARMGMLALAEELSNVSKACQRAGISRSHFYEIVGAQRELPHGFPSGWRGQGGAPGQTFSLSGVARGCCSRLYAAF